MSELCSLVVLDVNLGYCFCFGIGFDGLFEFSISKWSMLVECHMYMYFVE